jgi:predicted nucleic-acid-binding protein
MKITADTNLLVRAMTNDTPDQAEIARRELIDSEMVILTRQALCETVWVLSQGYRIPAPEIAAGIRKLIAAPNIVVDRLAAQAGLDMLDAGGDFADGVIALEGRLAGSDNFVSFDKKAVRLLSARGYSARLAA